MQQAAGLIEDLNPAEIALLIESLPPARRNIVWNLVSEEDDAEVLAKLNDEVRTRLMKGMDTKELLNATEGMELDDLADVVADLPESITKQVIHSLNQRDRERLEAVLSYPEDSAGGLMNPDTITVRPNVSLEVVLRYLRALGKLPDNTYSLFVVDRNDKYLGKLRISRIVTHDLIDPVRDAMDKDAQTFTAEMPATEVAREFQNLDLISAPVVDDSGHLLGQITIDDVVDVISEQADHDILSMAGLDEEDDIFAPVIVSAGRRAIWLGVNLATAFIAAAVVGMFKDTLEEVVVLAVLMPVVASMGGIAGTQTLTLMIRGMALGRVENSNARWLLTKEVAVGVFNGCIWAAVVLFITIIFFAKWDVGLVIGAAVAINLIIAAFAGVIVPLILRRMNIDAALAGGVVLTTVTDVVGFITFLGLGALVLT
ncbi:MAG: magnesium transporter [Gammaproteobacteria bacterium]|nr:magnesium transporter [Gammaproteobacteria bacterium]MCP4088575.1 magnesium transporter [Gammaproteobacteria bacterium]MCP4276517.1 magnesium transporter [Gammaproteobacteria bacterium]MCP4832394.1 magnesium transporter [Gammaproteobacteria bacterium]MCP4929092.1 magnesium transporter [Gammaproteobacteria bacterium]